MRYSAKIYLWKFCQRKKNSYFCTRNTGSTGLCSIYIGHAVYIRVCICVRVRVYMCVMACCAGGFYNIVSGYVTRGTIIRNAACGRTALSGIGYVIAHVSRYDDRIVIATR